ncbi:MAG: hypothetical protein K9W42_04160 [Candidatus Heimdallarchaeota archaeon]|nr:hypothetical protein [Candidatus Heimdallarchaeota archaeon]
MLDYGIESLLIMDKGGIPLLFQKLDPKHSDVEPVLLSGFLTALKDFSLSIIDPSSDFQIDYGKRVLTILTGRKIVLAAIHTRKSAQNIGDILKPILDEFEMRFFSGDESSDTRPLEVYEPFRERIIDIMGITNPSLKWIPFFFDKSSSSLSSLSEKGTKIVSFIDNHHSIEEIISATGVSKDAVLIELSKLWAMGIIGFRNLLAEDDFIVTTNKIVPYLQPSSQEWQEIKKRFPNLIGNLPYIISHLDGRTTVGQITQQFLKEGLENVFWLLDYLYINEGISILSPEKRRILMAKEITSKTFTLAREFLSDAEIVRIIREVLKSLSFPEIISQIRLTDESWTLDFSFLPYNSLSPENIMAIYNQWLDLLRLFIFAFKGRKRRKFIHRLTEELDFAFFAKFRSEDMNGFEEFAFWLETIIK